MDQTQIQSLIDTALSQQHEITEQKHQQELQRSEAKYKWSLAIASIAFPVIVGFITYNIGVSTNLSDKKYALTTNEAIQKASKELNQEFDRKIEKFEETVRKELRDNRSFQQEIMARSVEDAKVFVEASLQTEKAQSLITQIEKSLLKVQSSMEIVETLKKAADDFVNETIDLDENKIANLLKASLEQKIKAELESVLDAKSALIQNLLDSKISDLEQKINVVSKAAIDGNNTLQQSLNGQLSDLQSSLQWSQLAKTVDKFNINCEYRWKSKSPSNIFDHSYHTVQIQYSELNTVSVLGAKLLWGTISNTDTSSMKLKRQGTISVLTYNDIPITTFERCAKNS